MNSIVKKVAGLFAVLIIVMTTTFALVKIATTIDSNKQVEVVEEFNVVSDLKDKTVDVFCPPLLAVTKEGNLTLAKETLVPWTFEEDQTLIASILKKTIDVSLVKAHLAVKIKSIKTLKNELIVQNSVSEDPKSGAPKNNLKTIVLSGNAELFYEKESHAWVLKKIHSTSLEIK